ncbi:MAG: hypothetical protein Q8L14_23715 [Myxococcales bacterium]|nr:hypothetical protein [Myxococcales bacterium]
MRICLALVSLVTLVACRPTSVPKNAEPMLLAVGAQVDLRVTNGCGNTRVICTKAPVATVESVTSDASDIVEVVQRAEAVVTVLAKTPGVTRLSAQFVDADGTRRETTAWVEVKALTHSTVSVNCEYFTPVRSVHPVSPGATFTFDARGFADDDELDTGALPLFEAPGFSLAGSSSGQTQATAPTTPGAYAWTLVGGGAVQFKVFEEAEVSVGLNVDVVRSKPRPELTAQLLIDGVVACVQTGRVPVWLSATSGQCFPVAADLELRGAVPIDLGRGVVKLELEGDGQPCTLTARLADGRSTSVTATVPRLGPAVTPTPQGTVLHPGGVDVPVQAYTGIPCSGSLSDGKCSNLYDGDCYVDSDWAVQHSAPALPDAGSMLSDRDLVGVGLVTSLRLRVEIQIPVLPNIVVGPPKNLMWRTNHTFVLAGRVAVSDALCSADRYQRLIVTPEAAGRHGFEFRAENLDDVGVYSFDASDVARVTWQFQDAARHVSTFDPTEAFVRSTLVPAAGYESTFRRTLRGEGPLRFSADSPDGGSKASGAALFTGDVPHVVTVASPLAGPASTVLVRDATGLVGVGNFEDRTVKVGETACMAPFVPMGPLGRRILGSAPVRPSLEVLGSGLVVSATEPGRPACLVGIAPGTATMKVDWGAASVSRTWQIVP